MPRNIDLDSEFQDESFVQPQRRQMQPSSQMGAGMPSGRASARRKKNQTTSIIILAVEIVVFIALLVLFFVLKNKIENPKDAPASAVETEAGAETAEDTGSSGGVNVESNDFTLTCTKVQLANDVNGNPAAVIYFTFVNKTETPLSMIEVFPPSLVQNGMDCAPDATLTEYPMEYENRQMQVSGGQSVDCCYAFSIFDLTSPLTLTIHDNYATFTDIGSTEIPIS